MTTTGTREGVIRFVAEHCTELLSSREHGDVATRLSAWRALWVRLGAVGQDASRYDGAGYGNVSARVGAPSSPRGARAFLISGTQTGMLPRLELSHYALVERYAIAGNRVQSRGPVLPSSEAMTHGALYDLSPALRWVFHGHCPEVWWEARALRLPTTNAAVEYGTPDMAREVQRLWTQSPLPEVQVLVMGGHQDGVMAFGRTAEEAGHALVRAWVRAVEQSH